MLYRRLILEWVIVTLAATLFVVCCIHLRLLEPLDNVILDTASALRPAQADSRIVLAEIDDESLRAVGAWPWPRSVHARFLRTIAAVRPVAIGYDVLFLEPTADDRILAEAMDIARPVFLPILPPRPDEPTGGIELPVAPIMAAAAGWGTVDIQSDTDGVVRHFARSQEPFPYLVETIADHVLPDGKSLREAAVTGNAPLLMRYAAPGNYARIPIHDILAGTVPARELSGKIIIVGGTATGFGDRFPVPSYAGGLLSGIELQANMLTSLLQGNFRRELPAEWRIALGIAPIWLLLTSFLRFSPAVNLRLSIAAITLTLALSVGLLVFADWWFPPAATLLSLILVYSLWGWRRLAAANAYITQEARYLSAEPDIAPGEMATAVSNTTPLPRGDAVMIGVERLHHVIARHRALRHFVQDVIARLPDAVCVLDRGDKVVMGNVAADALFGGEVRGQLMSALFTRLGHRNVEPGAEITLADGRTLVILRAMLDGGGTIVRLADVSALRKASDEREAALGFLSHDMRAPHAAIIALLDGQESGANADDSIGAASAIRQHAERGLKLADDFVELARLEHANIRPHPVDLCGSAAEAVDLIYPLSRRRQIVIVESGLDTDIWVSGDEALLIRAIVNLLDNAVKFSPDGGTVACRVMTGDHDATLIVESIGPPMPTERQGDPFQSVARGRDTKDRSSRGLGLVFVKRAIERQGGSVGYHEEENGKKLFTIRLPLADSPAENDTAVG